MGFHYLPQRYLRGFEAPAEKGAIWMFDKKEESCKLLPIKLVAQATDFYSEHVEKSLNIDVEQPGNDVIDKIRSGKAIDETDQLHLTYYIATMIRRVPHARGKGHAMIPQVLAETASEIRTFFEQEYREGRIDSETLAARIAETDAAESKFRNQPPSEVTNIIETPWPFASMLLVIHSMYWRLFRSNGPSYFLTSDNPAHFFEGYGLGHEYCELTFPLCTDLVLHCSWKSGNRNEIQPCPEKLVKEFNRRIASGAERFVFYHDQAPWVHSVAKCHPSQLSRINWE